MTLTCIGTGSSGNCYLLKSDCGTLILDCGVPVRKIKETLNWDFSEVVGVVVTHQHKDHANAMKDLKLLGIPFFTPFFRQYGGFIVTAVPLKDKTGKWLHTNGDGSECEVYGFLIEAEGHRIAYFTDFEYLPYTFRKTPITDFLIACNHEDDMEYEDSAKEYHSILGHSSLSTVKEIIRVNRTPELKNVILCHLTWAADRGKMLKDITSVVDSNVNVCIAEAGTTYLL